MNIKINSTEGLKAQTAGGERVVPFPSSIDIPADAFDITCDAEADTLTWKTVDTEGVETESELTIPTHDELVQVVEDWQTAELAKPFEPSLKSAMYAAWKALDDEVRDPFIPYWPAVNLAIDIGDTPEAVRILNAVTVPAELESVRQYFLSMIS